MSPELQAAYDEAARPFFEGGGAITIEQTRMRSWRYFVEINSACNLRCPTCTKGNMAGYDHKTGIMEWSLFLAVLDKIKAENPQAIVFLYGNSEPFLHPKLPECIAAVKERGLRCEFSTNLNHVARVDEVIEARPDMVIVSLSGFTQDVYSRGHAGGDVEKVKRNMKAVGAANAGVVDIRVNYHVYTDNGHEVEAMREYAKSCEIGFFTSYARAISMENAIQYCRSHDEGATPFVVQEGRPDWNHVLPKVTPTYSAAMARVCNNPADARNMYAKYPIHSVCPVGDMFTFIRHDGKTSLCACVADRRITLGDYITTTQERLSEQRRGHSICQQCLKYRMNLYFHIVDREKWGE